MKVIFYTKENCSLCEDARTLLTMLRHEYPFELEERDIYTNDTWLEEYQLIIPLVQINGRSLNCEEISLEALEQLLKNNIHR